MCAEERNFESGLASVGQNRRSFLTELLSIATIASVISAVPVVEQYVKGLVKTTEPWRKRDENVQRLFFPAGIESGGRIQLIPSDDHPKLVRPEGLFASTAVAYRAIAQFFPMSSEAKVVEAAFPVGLQMLPIAVGASNSNQLTRLVLGHPEKPRWRWLGAGEEASRHSRVPVGGQQGFLAELPFSIEYTGESITRLREGQQHQTRASGVARPNHEWVAVPKKTRAGKQTSDVLLITRVPWDCLGGCDVVIFAGLHGAGTRAVEHVLYHAAQEVGKLADQLENAQHFQAVFEIPRLAEDEGNLVPETVKFITCAPVPISSLTGVKNRINPQVIKEIQRRLQHEHFNPGPIDGIFGPTTSAALCAYQRAHRLPETGVIDDATQRHFFGRFVR
jgi:hypothetical protein